MIYEIGCLDKRCRQKQPNDRIVDKKQEHIRERPESFLKNETLKTFTITNYLQHIAPTPKLLIKYKGNNTSKNSGCRQTYFCTSITHYLDKNDKTFFEKKLFKLNSAYF